MNRLRIFAGVVSGILAVFFAFVSIGSWLSIRELRSGKKKTIELSTVRSDTPVKFEPFDHVDFVFVCVGETYLDGSTFVWVIGATAAACGGISVYLLRRRRRGA